jgi:hypothetical protein
VITHIEIEWLGDGAIPIYDTADNFLGAPYYNLDTARTPGFWEELRIPHSHRLVVPVAIDAFLSKFKQDLPSWLAELDPLGDGCLFFPIRAITGAIVEEGPLVLCGLSYLPFPPEIELYHDIGTPLNGADPVDLINQVLDQDYRHPIVQKAREQQETLRYQRREVERQMVLRMKDAETRSRRLLREMLTPEQERDLNEKKCFNVRGQDGLQYCIVEEPHRNIYLMQEGRAVRRFCIVMRNHSIPIYDMMLAQKLVIEHDIERFLAVSNKWDICESHGIWTEAIVPLDPAVDPALFAPDEDEDNAFRELLAELLADQRAEQRRAG